MTTDEKIDAIVVETLAKLQETQASEAMRKAWQDFKEENPEDDAECPIYLHLLFDAETGHFLTWQIEHNQYFVGHSGPVAVVDLQENYDAEEIKRAIDRDIGETLWDLLEGKA